MRVVVNEREPLAAADVGDVACALAEWAAFVNGNLDAVAAWTGAETTLVGMRQLSEPWNVKRVGLGYDGVGRR